MNLKQIQEEEKTSMNGKLTIDGKDCSVKIKKSGDKFVVEPKDKNKLMELMGMESDEDEKDEKNKEDEDMNDEMEENINPLKSSILENSGLSSINNKNMTPMKMKKSEKKFYAKDEPTTKINVENMSPMQMKKELKKFYAKDTDSVKEKNVKNMSPMQMKKELKKFYAKSMSKRKVWENTESHACNYCGDVFETVEQLEKHKRMCQ